MNFSRRSFLGGSAALFGSVATAGTAAAYARRTDRPRLKMGVISDTHIGTGWMMGINSPATEKALRAFRDENVDAVAVLGDFTNGGTVEQLREFARCWYAVFPEDRGRDGRHVEKLIVTGNHDIACWKPVAKQGDDAIAPRIAELWREFFHEDYAPAWRKEINGIQVTGNNWGLYEKTDIKDAHRREDVEPVLKEAFAKARPGDPVFHLRHGPPPNTTAYSGSHPYGSAAELFGEDERLFVLFGHIHKPSTDPRTIWQGSYTALYGGVITWTEFPPYCWPKPLPAGGVYAKSMCMVSVYGDEIVVSRTSAWTGESLGDDWRIPLPLSRDTFPYTPEKQAARAATPTFPSGAAVVANMGMGENAFGRILPNRKSIQGKGGIVLTFPAATVQASDDMVMRYNVETVRADSGEKVADMCFYTDFHRGRSYLQSRYEFLFPAEKLPDDVPCRFAVRAEDFFGNVSAPIVSEAIAFRNHI